MSAEQREWRRAVRNEPIRISYEVWAVLRLVAKSKGSIEPGLPRMTEDQLADEILLEALKALHPKIFEHRKAVEKLEKALVAEIGGTNDNSNSR